jgi:thioredoxin 1
LEKWLRGFPQLRNQPRPPKERINIMASANVVVFTNDNWQKEVVESSVPVVVDFWAPWCGPCRALSPTIDKLATSYAGRVKVGKLNVDDAQDLAVKYSVTNIPRVYIFKGGDKPRRQIVGLVSESELTKAIDGVLAEQ